MTIERAHSTNGRVAHGEPYESAPPTRASRRLPLRRFLGPAILALAAIVVLRRIATRPEIV